MTPREADVAFVLEGLEGVVAVQAFRGNQLLDFAVRVDGARAMARAHAALLRVLTHVECRRVLFYYDAMPSPLALKAEDLVLTAEERAAARARVPATSSALEEGRGLPPVDPTQKRILVVDARPDTASAVAASAPDAVCVVEPNVEAALVRARAEPFDMFLCDADRAFGDNGFLVRLAAIDAFGVTRVTVVAHAQDLRFTMNRLEQIGRINSVLTHPLDVGTLTLAIRYGGIYVESWKIPAPPPGERPPIRRVLLVDDDPVSVRLVTASQTTDVGGVGLIFTLAKDAWEALEHIGAEWDAVVCSITMKTESGVPVYRMLWNNRPELKGRFAFLASQDCAPLSGVSRVITRPLSLEAVAIFLERR